MGEKPPLAEYADQVADQLMKTASGLVQSGLTFEQVFAFLVGNRVQMVSVSELQTTDKSEITELVRTIAQKTGARCVFTAGEGLISHNPMATPGNDPAAMEAIMITASGAGVNFMLTRTILGEGELGEIEKLEGFQGRYSNLSGNEGMN